MSGFAKVTAEGIIAGAVTLRWKPEGDPVLCFSLAVGRTVRSEFHAGKWTDYFDVRMVMTLDEAAGKSRFRKGDAVRIEGHLRQERHKLRKGERSRVVIEAVALERCGAAACS